MKKIILRVLGFIGVTLLMLVLCLYCVMWVVTKGPSEQARNLFVLSVRETSMASFLCFLEKFLQKKTVAGKRLPVSLHLFVLAVRFRHRFCRVSQAPILLLLRQVGCGNGNPS